jgi:nuclear receptor interaction protein
LVHFDQIKPAVHEGKHISRESRFCYDFLKAILLWLDEGQSAVLEAFKRPSHVSSESPRFPLERDDTVDAAIDKLRSYLLSLADEDVPVVDLDTNRFERDESRHVFHSQPSAVNSFMRALAGIRLESRQGMSETRPDDCAADTTVRVMDKGAAARFWGVKVGRSLLMRAAEGVTFDFVNRAFGGLRSQRFFETQEEEWLQDVDPDEEERVVEAIDLVTTTDGPAETSAGHESPTALETADGSTRSDLATSTPPTVHVEDADEDDNDNEDDDDEGNDDDAEDSEGARSDSDEDDDDDYATERILFRRRTAFGRYRERASVNEHVPYSSHTKVYKGHCNTRTVKDVNYYGLNDEYVVSGSDDGHFFIWDRKTCRILNILEGDGEVVNVVQGHPYEPLIACSGIDSTIKVFGPGGDSREREHAQLGTDIANSGGGQHPSLRFAAPHRAWARRHEEGDEQAADTRIRPGGLPSRRAMHRSYEITSQNDVGRQHGAEETFVTVGGTAAMEAIEAMLARGWLVIESADEQA